MKYLFPQIWKYSTMGLAIAEDLKGPYVQLPFVVTANNLAIEDGIQLKTYEKGFHRINEYTNVDMTKVAVHYGPENRNFAKFERPQLLLIDGKPEYLYVPSGSNIYGGDCTMSYVLKFKN